MLLVDDWLNGLHACKFYMVSKSRIILNFVPGKHYSQIANISMSIVGTPVLKKHSKTGNAVFSSLVTESDARAPRPNHFHDFTAHEWAVLHDSVNTASPKEVLGRIRSVLQCKDLRNIYVH